MADRKSKKAELISVIIPAYNEGKPIKQVIKDILQVAKSYPLEIIVVNDGSHDDTATVAKKAGAHKVITHRVNMGKGAAFRTGLKNAKGEYVVQIDADRQLYASEIPKLVTPLQNGFDVVLGARYSILSFIKPGSLSFLNMSGNLFLSFCASIFSGKMIPDVMTGFKAFKKKVALDINPNANHFGYEAELVVKAAKKNYRIKNILISTRKRETGKSNLRIVKHGLLVLTTIINSSFGKE